MAESKAVLSALFESTGHELFIQAFEQDMSSGLPPDFYGKPLDAFGLLVARLDTTAKPTTNPWSSVEVWKAHVFTVDQAEAMSARRDAEQVQALARSIGNRSLTTVADLRSLPPGAILSDYSASRSHSTGGITQRQISLEPKKAGIEKLRAGLSFLSSVRDYLESDDYGKHPVNELIPRDASSATLRWAHHWTLDQRWNLPLNGEESEEWLMALRMAGLQQLQQATNALAQRGISREVATEHLKTIANWKQTVAKIDAIFSRRSR